MQLDFTIIATTIVSKPQLYYCVRALFVIASTIASLVAVNLFIADGVLGSLRNREKIYQAGLLSGIIDFATITVSKPLSLVIVIYPALKQGLVYYNARRH